MQGARFTQGASSTQSDGPVMACADAGRCHRGAAKTALARAAMRTRLAVTARIGTVMAGERDPDLVF